MTVENRAYGDLNTFEEACRRADKQQRRKPDNPRIARARRLLADDVSFERAWYELNRRDGAAASTLEALVFSLRSGVGALARRDVQARLSELNKNQLGEVCARLLAHWKWSLGDLEAIASLWGDLDG
jgi:hypothetical protein